MPGTEAKVLFRLEEDLFKKQIELNGRGQKNRLNDDQKEKLILN